MYTYWTLTLVSVLLVVVVFFGNDAVVTALAPHPTFVNSRTSMVITRLQQEGTTMITTMSSSPITIERGPAVLEPPTLPATKERESTKTDDPVKDRRRMGHEAWEVRIYNDGLNTREHVARSLVQVTGMSEMNAYQTMMQAHQNGIAVVGRWVYEVAEMYHDALRQNGIICDIVPVDEET